MEIEFFGAAGEVTGSCHILRINGNRVLLDCGLIQGGRKQEARNYDEFPFRVADIDAVVLSHAHLDHSGRLPLLVKRGYKGPIYVQHASRALAEVLLRDAASLAERDAERRNRKRERAGKRPVSALYTETEARNVVKLMRPLRYLESTEILPGTMLTFQDAGHILGSAVVKLDLTSGSDSASLVFSGDLGQYNTPILRDPTTPDHADMVIMESTYGGRKHRSRDETIAEIGTVMKNAAHGNIIIPAFAVGRSQELLYLFGRHYDEWEMDRWKIFLDSPLAIAASRIYWKYPHLYDDEATRLRKNNDEMPTLPNLHFTESPAESRVINKLRHGAIILAGSGMCNGGRVLHHLKHNLWRKECHVMIVGYQAIGSTGRRLVDRDKYIRIHGDEIRNRATLHTVGGLSAHGDEEDLLRWYNGFTNRPKVCLVHGEPSAGEKLAAALQGLGANVQLPQPGTRVSIL